MLRRQRISVACLVLFFALIGPASVSSQVDEICGEFGFMATLDAPRLAAPYVYGRVAIKASSTPAKFPKITVVYTNRGQSPSRVTVSKSGNYCFKILSGSGGNLVIEVDGVEVARRDVASFGTAQQREDFDIKLNKTDAAAPPGVISTKFSYTSNERTSQLYRDAGSAESSKELGKAIALMNEVVRLDAADFVAWTYLGNLHLEQGTLKDAEVAYRKSIELRNEYPTPWVNMGRLRVAQKQYEAAVEIFKHAAALEPTDAKTFRLLGEAYLMNKQGTLGAQALNHAIRLDPIGMAECHLQLAHLFQLANAKHLAAAEYKKFLEKVPDHPDRKKYEKFIKENQ